MQGIIGTVYEIIEMAQNSEVLCISRQLIKDEMKLIDKYKLLSEEKYPYHSNSKKSKLDCAIDQALYYLNKSNRITRIKVNGKKSWRVSNESTQLVEICSHLSCVQNSYERTFVTPFDKIECLATKKIFFDKTKMHKDVLYDIEEIYKNCANRFRENNKCRYDCKLAHCAGCMFGKSNKYTREQSKMLIDLQNQKPYKGSKYI